MTSPPTRNLRGRRWTQMHIGMCRNCRRYVRQVKATAGALRLLPAPPMPPELEDELMRRFEGWKGARR